MCFPYSLTVCFLFLFLFNSNKNKTDPFIQGRFHYLLPTVKVTTLRAAVPSFLLLIRFLICLLVLAFAPCHQLDFNPVIPLTKLLVKVYCTSQDISRQFISNWYYSNGLKLTFQDQLNSLNLTIPTKMNRIVLFSHIKRGLRVSYTQRT
jgi:hypothetical protein